MAEMSPNVGGMCHYFEVKMTEQEILTRIRAGEKCRWVPCTDSGQKGIVTTRGEERHLFLGRKKLNDDDEIRVMGMVEAGNLKERNQDRFTYYEES